MSTYFAFSISISMLALATRKWMNYVHVWITVWSCKTEFGLEVTIWCYEKCCSGNSELKFATDSAIQRKSTYATIDEQFSQ